jgi:hypothetical protein
MLLASFKSTSFIIILDLVGLSLYSIGHDGNIFQPKLESNIHHMGFFYTFVLAESCTTKQEKDTVNIVQ